MTRKAIVSRLLGAFYVMALAIWIGGFTFYSGVVLPILHEELGDAFAVGMITRRVTHYLNAIGAATVASGWSLVAMGRSAPGTTSGDVPRRVGISATTLLLVFLIGLHRLMDRLLDSGSLQHFYSWHRAYLWASIVQWLVNLSLLIGGPRPSDRDAHSPRSV